MSVLVRSICVFGFVFAFFLSAHAQSTFELPIGVGDLSYEPNSTGLLVLEFDNVDGLDITPEIEILSGEVTELASEVFRIDQIGRVELFVNRPEQWQSQALKGRMAFTPAFTLDEPNDSIETARTVEANAPFIISLLTSADRDFVRVEIDEPSIVEIELGDPDLVSIFPRQGSSSFLQKGVIAPEEPFYTESSIVLELAYASQSMSVMQTPAYIKVQPHNNSEAMIEAGDAASFFSIPNQNPSSFALTAFEDGIYRITLTDTAGLPIRAWVEGQPDKIATADRPLVVALRKGVHSVHVSADEHGLGAKLFRVQTEFLDKDDAEFSNADITVVSGENKGVYLHRGGDRDIISFVSEEPGYVTFEVSGNIQLEEPINTIGPRREPLTQSDLRDTVRAVQINPDGREQPVSWMPWGENTRRFGPISTALQPVRLAIWSADTDYSVALELTPYFSSLEPSPNVTLIGLGLDQNSVDRMSAAAASSGVPFFQADDEVAFDDVMNEILLDNRSRGNRGSALLWIGSLVVALLMFLSLLLWRRHRSSLDE